MIRLADVKSKMVFTKGDGILIKILRQSKDYDARKLLEEFNDKDWFCSALDRLLRQIDATGSADRKSGSSRERNGLHKRHASVCANGDHFEHKL